MVGRIESENKMLSIQAKDGDFLFCLAKINGPLLWEEENFQATSWRFACEIVARYSDRGGIQEAQITFRRLPEKTATTLMTKSIARRTDPRNEDIVSFNLLILSIRVVRYRQT